MKRLHKGYHSCKLGNTLRVQTRIRMGKTFSQWGFSMSDVRNAALVCLLLITSVLTSASVVLADEEDGATLGTYPITVFEGYDVAILDAYAVTEVTRVMENPGDEAMNHTFAFRIPEGALISNFSIKVDGVTYFADVMEKEEAEEAYQQAVSAGNNAGLIASVGDQLFEYKVSFAPRELLVATLRYEQVLLKQNGWHEYYLPFDTEGYVDNFQEFEVSIDIEAPMDIEEFNSSGYDGSSEELVSGPAAHWSVGLVDVIPSDDVVLRWRTGGGPLTGVMYYGELDGSGYFLHVFDPDPSHFADSGLGMDFLFVLDRSGSMIGTKFDQSKEALYHIYGTLSSGDRFSLVHFDSVAVEYSSSLLPVNGTSVNSVLGYIQDLGIGGSTDIHSGVMAGMDIFKADGNAVPVMVLLTDGRANTGLYHRSSFREDVKAKNTVDAAIYTIALGNDADWTFLEALALENHGRAIWVMEDDDIVSTISDFVASFSSPLVSGLRFDYGPNAVDVHPSEVRAHYAGSEVLVAGRLLGGATEIPMMLNATTGLGGSLTEHVFPVGVLPSHDFVPRFWAFSRMQDLEDRMKYNGTDNASVQEITDLALDFHFVTDYTSLFVELPEDIQERFDSTTESYPAEMASSADHPPSAACSIFSGSTMYSQRTAFDSTTSSTADTADPADPGPATNDVDQSHDDGGNQQKRTLSVDVTSTASCGLDGEGIPDIEESYNVPHYLESDKVILPSELERDAIAESDVDATSGVPMNGPIAVLVMVLVPLSAVLLVAIHWLAFGRKRFGVR
ncbi:MAG: VWA domain-containing protein [Thermoplasmata archaeon]|nr:VWA domain-containing protein [Thermoplasmata archaeon]